MGAKRQGELVALHEYADASVRDHFYTVNPKDADSMIGYEPRGIACLVFRDPVPGLTQCLPHVVLTSKPDNIYTTDRIEYMDLVKHEYEDAGIACYVLEDRAGGAVALERFYHADSPDHLYAASPVRRREAVAQGYRYEKDEGFVFPARGAVSAQVAGDRP
jgi:hypothetical protein